MIVIQIITLINTWRFINNIFKSINRVKKLPTKYSIPLNQPQDDKIEKLEIISFDTEPNSPDIPPPNTIINKRIID